MITIKEIAEKAGVSPGTVDRVLHKRGRVSRKNEENIRRIAEENGYVPNQLARRLQRKGNLVFGVLIPYPNTEYGYWQQVMDGIEEARKEIEVLDASIVYFSFSIFLNPTRYIGHLNLFFLPIPFLYIYLQLVFVYILLVL